MCGPMVVCGHCGNNCCNGGSNEGCPDGCESAYAMQKARSVPYELLEEWERMKRAGETYGAARRPSSERGGGDG